MADKAPTSKAAPAATDQAVTWTADQVRAIEALAKAEKYWTASEAQVALFKSLDGEAILAAAPTKKYGVNLDVDRLYLETTGPDAAAPAVRELALKLREGGCKAHAVAFLCGIPPRFVSAMWAGATKARAEAAKAPVEAVA